MGSQKWREYGEISLGHVHSSSWTIIKQVCTSYPLWFFRKTKSMQGSLIEFKTGTELERYWKNWKQGKVRQSADEQGQEATPMPMLRNGTQAVRAELQALLGIQILGGKPTWQELESWRRCKPLRNQTKQRGGAIFWLLPFSRPSFQEQCFPLLQLH